ncbi:MAG: glutathione S-transferase [Robiginitomaculum sp.]|nr:MAG: glutathione S-transferase [Robiginitomaculum sp.]
MATQDPIELYFFPTPNGWKVSIALEEMGLPYDMIPVMIGQGDQFKPEFLAISPNNKMPAIIDPDGPDGKPISIFESGAILQYLARKTGKFYGQDERGRVAVEEWLMWQMGGLGPMAGQAHHFRGYSDEEIPYAIERYTNEVNRLYGVMNKRLEGRNYLADEYSIADMACWGWIFPHERQGQDLNDFPNLKAWFEGVSERPAVQRGHALGADLRADLRIKNEETDKAKAVLFGQKARD